MSILFSQAEKKKDRKISFHMDEPDAALSFGKSFQQLLLDHSRDKIQPKIVVCIGTDRSTGDCLGPLIGSKMAETNHTGLEVFGTLDEPVHAGNLVDYLQKIRANWHSPFIIAIDACLGRMDSVGVVNIGTGSLRPGAGVNKDLPPVGNLHITGIVNVGGFMEYFVLQNTRLSTVMRMANLISAGMTYGWSQYRLS